MVIANLLSLTTVALSMRDKTTFERADSRFLTWSDLKLNLSVWKEVASIKSRPWLVIQNLGVDDFNHRGGSL